jgi:CHAD domain-containing protein
MAWRFEPGEALGKAFRRVAAEEIAKVRGGLTDPQKDRAKAIHEARQGFKRLRALLRLAKPSVGSAFGDENRRWRDAGRQLAGTRDQTVLMETFDKLVDHCGADLPESDLKRLRSFVVANGAEGGDLHGEVGVRYVLDLIDDAQKRLDELHWPGNAKALARALHGSQRKLKETWKKARKSVKPADLHEWRKRVKDQSSQLRLFRKVAPPALRSRHDDAKKTAELLGEEHDYWMLEERLSDDALPAEAAATRDVLLGEIGKIRAALRSDALNLGKGFSSQGAGAFAREMTAAWEKAARAKAKAARAKQATSQVS